MKKTSFDQGVSVGALAAFIVFLVLGAVPGLLYGGYLGMMTANALIGHDLTMIHRLMAGGGMLLGFFASFGLFVVIGGALGGTLGAAYGNVATPSVEQKPVRGPV